MAEALGGAAAIVQESSHLRLTVLAKLLRRNNSALAKAAQRLETTHIVREIVTGIEANKVKDSLVSG